MKIGIFSEPHNRQAATLKQRIHSLAPGTSRHFTLPAHGAPAVAVDETGVYWDDVNVGQLDKAYMHGFSYASPVVPEPLGDIDWSVWQTHHIAQQQRTSFIYSAWQEMERSNVKLFNPLRTQVQSFMKADLLEDLREAGLRVPRMVCTNHMETAHAFVTEVEHTLWRPSTGRAAWQLFLEKQRDHLITPTKPPILLAELVEGLLIRCYLLEGKPLLCLKRTAPVCLPMEALELLEATECPAVYRELQRVAEVIPMGWGQVLFILKDEQAWIYDVDADPIYDWLPDVYQQRLTDGFAMGLLGMAPETPLRSALPDTPQPRPTLFLRRMLQILFEFEYKKYHQP